MAKFTSTLGPGEPEEYRKVESLIRDFYQFLEFHRIYLSDEMEAALYNFIKFIKGLAIPVIDFKNFGRANARDATGMSYRSELLKAAKAVNDVVPALRGELIKEFRAKLD